MEHEKFDAALEKEDLFSYNEERANHYAATCLKFAAIVATLMWVLKVKLVSSHFLGKHFAD